MSLVRFGVATFAGSAIWCTAIALVGYELVGEWTKITKGFSAAGYVLVAVAVVVIGVFILHRLSAVRRERDAGLH
jgi:membrane protein DedA with SNARE-associated domain